VLAEAVSGVATRDICLQRIVSIAKVFLNGVSSSVRLDWLRSSSQQANYLICDQVMQMIFDGRVVDRTITFSSLFSNLRDVHEKEGFGSSGTRLG
jgi:hypothetical protein